jgi:hypothetical protein
VAKLETGSQNSDTTASNDREQYHLLFSSQTANPETFGYTLVVSLDLLRGLINENQVSCPMCAGGKVAGA